MEIFTCRRKTKTKAITPTNHNWSKQRDEPIRIPSNYLWLAQSAGKTAIGSTSFPGPLLFSSSLAPGEGKRRGPGNEVAIGFGFGFTSHWLKNWNKMFKPITKRSNRNGVINFYSHLKTALRWTTRKWVIFVLFILEMMMFIVEMMIKIGRCLLSQTHQVYKTCRLFLLFFPFSFSHPFFPSYQLIQSPFSFFQPQSLRGWPLWACWTPLQQWLCS